MHPLINIEACEEEFIRPIDDRGKIVPCTLVPDPRTNQSVLIKDVGTAPETLLSTSGNFSTIPRRVREECQRPGVKLVDVPNGRSNAADKANLVDNFLFALDNRLPFSILLILGHLS